MNKLDFNICDKNCCTFDIYDKDENSFKLLICYDQENKFPYNVQINREQDEANVFYDKEFIDKESIIKELGTTYFNSNHFCNCN